MRRRDETGQPPITNYVIENTAPRGAAGPPSCSSRISSGCRTFMGVSRRSCWALRIIFAAVACSVAAATVRENATDVALSDTIPNSGFGEAGSGWRELGSPMNSTAVEKPYAAATGRRHLAESSLPILWRIACWNVDHRFIMSTNDVNFNGNGGFLDVGIAYPVWQGQWYTNGQINYPPYVRAPILVRHIFPLLWSVRKREN